MTDPLLEGFRQFREENYGGSNTLMRRLVQDGQSPTHFIISCIDSRSNPGTIFRPAPGTFLAHKAMGAIVRPYKKGTALAAALQFAIVHNKVKEIVILGHTGCGAIKALVDKIEDEEISSFIDVAQVGLKKARELCGPQCAPGDLLRHAEEQIVLQSTENLRAYPSVKNALAAKTLVLKSWLFDMDTGNLFEYCADKQSFLPITDH
jgi:carbonic anhydrase